MGGIGKSSIAAECARQLLAREKARAVFWVPEQARDADPSQDSQGIKLLDSHVVDVLIRQLGLPDWLNESCEGKLIALAESGNLEHALVVLDGVVPSSESERGVARVVETIRPGMLLVTSRAEFDVLGCWRTKVNPLSSRDGVDFMRRDAERRGLIEVLPRSRGRLVSMCAALGGLPFALQLALGMASRLPWNSVMASLPSGNVKLYRYLFRDLWRGLSAVAQKALIYMRTSPNGVALHEILSAEQIGPSDAVALALNELVRLALVDVQHIGTRTASYGIHPLTHSFIMSDLPRLWEGAAEGRADG